MGPRGILYTRKWFHVSIFVQGSLLVLCREQFCSTRWCKCICKYCKTDKWQISCKKNLKWTHKTRKNPWNAHIIEYESTKSINPFEFFSYLNCYQHWSKQARDCGHCNRSRQQSTKGQSWRQSRSRVLSWILPLMRKLQQQSRELLPQTSPHL